ncbi:hypothetical protein CRG98_000383 [Punica granatum]|uniref:DUF7950 domain-containing protein n=1 Tax=Punica granatum TaxID=22663 RepID=A0A2I0LEI5_PUNGR|nr:hypothetical protein CRG98_000383 [Punica granatum]
MDVGGRQRCAGGVGGGGAAGGDDRVMIDRVMMLRFRPIAPKPADGDPAAGGGQFSNKSLLLSKIRMKRKYVRVRSRSAPKSSGTSSSNGRKTTQSSEKAIVTLQLLPEKAEHPKESSKAAKGRDSLHPHSSSIPIPIVRPIESWVIVESVGTGPYPDALELGRTDEERAEGLRSATCPGFVSDSLNRVLWVNGAYNSMVRKGFAGGGEGPELAVGMLVKGELPRSCGAFSCRVRVQDTWREERRSQVVPCDVWRMDFGGFAWRLDVRAALSLGRPLN